MCMISKEAAVVKLVSSRPQQIYVDEDDELKEIDANRNRIAASFSPINASPPLPSPPPENDTEILPYHEPLPSPPLFVSEQKQNNGSERVETIYANLEMLKIQYSVVSSTSQTNTSNEKHSVKYSSSVEDIASNISSEETSHSVQSEFVEAKPQVDDPFMEKIFQNQEKNLRMLNLPFNSAYFTTSVPKAKLLTRYTSKLHPNKMTEVKELSNEKEELIASLRKKLNILLEEEAALQDELRQNEELGNNLSDKLDGTATQNELKKFRNHVQELEKITNLLLSLSGRLARTKNALLILPSDASAEEKVLLDTKYKKLTQQYEEALHLQKDIDNRNKQVLVYLQKYLNKDELADYNHFIKMKVKLLVDYKED
ncbi:Protein Shroom3 like protein [Argiope bruennichi]|uniref:Protein Shroom3 like protein n=1 Tax=Argiope bruennichi TaxID=94029 RepID=A0A8T0F8G1_ARGBR|nr:Protein Shroom3 like protein [Argiope bruennichi]